MFHSDLIRESSWRFSSLPILSECCERRSACSNCATFNSLISSCKPQGSYAAPAGNGSISQKTMRRTLPPPFLPSFPPALLPSFLPSFLPPPLPRPPPPPPSSSTPPQLALLDLLDFSLRVRHRAGARPGPRAASVKPPHYTLDPPPRTRLLGDCK